MKKTEWFDGAKFVPNNVGVYQKKFKRFIKYQYWNGKFWGLYCLSAIHAYECRKQRSAEQNLDWRGIKK